MTFGYQTHFFSQFAFKLHLTGNVWLFTVSPRTRSDVAVHNINYETPSFYIERLGNPTFYNIRHPCLSLNTLRGSQTTFKCGPFSKKSVMNTFQTCVDITNEYMQAYNKGAGVKKHLLCRLHQCKCASYTMLLFAFVLSN